LVVGKDHDPDLRDPSGREEEWAGHQQGHGIVDYYYLYLKEAMYS